MLIARLMMALLGLSLLSSLVKAEDENTDTTGHGAVLCVYMINVELLAIGDRCFPNKDTEVKAALAQSVADIERFVINNSERTQPQLDEVRNSYRERMYRSDSICEGAGNLYQMFAKRGASAIKTATDKLLAVPRKPNSNPCL